MCTVITYTFYDQVSISGNTSVTLQKTYKNGAGFKEEMVHRSNRSINFSEEIKHKFSTGKVLPKFWLPLTIFFWIKNEMYSSVWGRMSIVTTYTFYDHISISRNTPVTLPKPTKMGLDSRKKWSIKQNDRSMSLKKLNIELVQGKLYRSSNYSRHSFYLSKNVISTGFGVV